MMMIKITIIIIIIKQCETMLNNQTMNNWSNFECICTEQKLINYTSYLYVHFIFTLFILFFTLSIAIYSLNYLFYSIYQ